MSRSGSKQTSGFTAHNKHPTTTSQISAVTRELFATSQTGPLGSRIPASRNLSKKTYTSKPASTPSQIRSNVLSKHSQHGMSEPDIHLTTVYGLANVSNTVYEPELYGSTTESGISPRICQSDILHVGRVKFRNPIKDKQGMSSTLLDEEQSNHSHNSRYNIYASSLNSDPCNTSVDSDIDKKSSAAAAYTSSSSKTPRERRRETRLLNKGLEGRALDLNCSSLCLSSSAIHHSRNLSSMQGSIQTCYSPTSTISQYSDSMGYTKSATRKSSLVSHVSLLGQQYLMENGFNSKPSNVHLSSSNNSQTDVLLTTKESALPFGSCELRLNLVQAVWEYIEKCHQQELRSIKRSCQLDVVKISDGELCLKVKTSSYDDLINRFQVIFTRLYDNLNAEITEIQTDLVGSEDGNEIKEKLEKAIKCVAHLNEGGHLEIICKKADRYMVDKIIQESIVSSAKFDKVESFPALGFEPTGYTVNGNIHVFLHINDIISLNVDAIINPANPTLEALGGLFSHIALAAGNDLEIECQRIIAKINRNLKVGEVVRTTAGRLPANYVLHVTGPMNLTDEDVEKCYSELVAVFENIIKYADANRLRTIAIPPISSGVYGVPNNIVAMAAYGMIDVLSETKYLNEIHFVDIGEEFLLKLQHLFEKDLKLGRIVQISSAETLSRIMSLVHSSVSGSASSKVQAANSASYYTSNETTSRNRKMNEEQCHFVADETVPNSNSTTDVSFTEKCFLLNRSVRVILSKQDISEMHVDAIVHPTNARLKNKTGIGRLLETKAGSQYIADCQTLVVTDGCHRISEVHHTRAGDLPCKMVFHAVTPRWLSDKKEQCVADLKNTLCNVFRKAKEMKIYSIACPIIGGGAASFPHDVIARVMVQTIQNIHIMGHNLKEVYIIDIHGQILDTVYKVFHESQKVNYFEEITGKEDILQHLTTKFSKNLVDDKKPEPLIEIINLSEKQNPLNHIDGSLLIDKHQEKLPKSRIISTKKPSVRSSSQAVVDNMHGLEHAMAQSSSGIEELKERQQQASSCKSLSDSNFIEKCFLVNHSVSVILSKQDINKMHVDAIIHPINRGLQHTKGLDILQTKAGSSYVAEYQKILSIHSSLKMSEVKKTCAGDLPCGMVLHAVIPRWSSEKKEQDQCVVDLEATFYNVFTFTEGSRLQSVAFPASIEGVGDIPCPVIARTICDTLLKTVNSASYLKEVYIVDLSDDILENIYNMFCNQLTKGYFEELDNRVRTSCLKIANNNKETHKEGSTRNQFYDDRDCLKSHSVKSHSRNRPNANNQDRASSPKKRLTPERTGTACQERMGLTSEEEQAACLKEESQLLEEKSDEITPSDIESQTGHRNADFPASESQRDVRPKQKSLASADQKREKIAASKQQTNVESLWKSLDETCMICLQSITEPKTLACSHTFCKDCIKLVFHKYHPKCPCCGRLYGICRGDQPEGNMRISKLSCSLPGYEGHKTIMITYEIPDGIQGENHPNPGHPYCGTLRTAYLPDNAEGRNILVLLQKAFDARLVFTIGHSVTTGAENVVVWNDIHHKTSIQGGPTGYGYPDPTYLSRVRQELADKGIK